MDSRAFLDFLKVAERLKCNTRHSYTSSGRHESVAEHSWRLTMMAYFMQDEFPEADIDKVIRMCMFHDMGEAITGDIPAFEKTDADSDHESHVMDQLLDTLPALIQHNEADLSTWIPLEYDLQMTYGTKECSFSEYMKELRDMVREDSKKKAGITD